MLRFFVKGTPKAQPRPKACKRGSFIHIYNPPTADEWKAKVCEAVSYCKPDNGPFDAPLTVSLAFQLVRPKSHRTKKGLSAAAPAQPTSKPDVDNLAKAVLDACTDAGMWIDDSQIINLYVSKEYAEGDVGGCEITVATLPGKATFDPGSD